MGIPKLPQTDHLSLALPALARFIPSLPFSVRSISSTQPYFSLSMPPTFLPSLPRSTRFPLPSSKWTPSIGPSTSRHPLTPTNHHSVSMALPQREPSTNTTCAYPPFSTSRLEAAAVETEHQKQKESISFGLSDENHHRLHQNNFSMATTNTHSSSSAEKPKIQDPERNLELGFPLLPLTSSPPCYNQELRQQQSSQFYPFPPFDYSSIFPVFPVEMEQGGAFDLGGPNSMNFLDPFHADMGVITEAAVEDSGAATSSRREDHSTEEPCLLVQRWAPAITKAARSKRRIARQMSNGHRPCLHHQQRRSSSPNSTSTAPSTRTIKKQAVTSASHTAEEFIPHPMPDNNRLRFVLQKELRNSDVSSLGRIVLPKRDSELNLPYLTAKEGIHVLISDLISSQLWSMRYRYWPNNKSKMYVLENTGEFVKKHGLTIGDFIVLYKDDSNQLAATQAIALVLSFQMAKISVSVWKVAEEETTEKVEKTKCQECGDTS